MGKHRKSDANFKLVDYDGGLSSWPEPIKSGSLVLTETEWQIIFGLRGFRRIHAPYGIHRWWLENNARGSLAILEAASAGTQQFSFRLPETAPEIVGPELARRGVTFCGARPEKIQRIDSALSSLPATAQRALREALEVGERVLVVIPGELSSALVGTDRRVLVYKKGITSGSFFSKQTNSWDYANISGIEAKTGMTTGAVVVQAPGVAPVTLFGRLDNGPSSVWEAPNAVMAVSKSTLMQSVTLLRRQVADHQQRNFGSNADIADPMDQLKKLAALREQGIVTEAEFQVKKQSLLSQ